VVQCEGHLGHLCSLFFYHTYAAKNYRHDFVAPVKCTNLVDFLAHAPRQAALIQTAENLRLVVLDLFDQLKHDNVIYAEIRFAPLLHTAQGLTPEQAVTAVDEAVAEGSKLTNIEARLILCTLRHYTEAQSMQTVYLVKQFQQSHVVGLDIVGDEVGFSLDTHIAAFQYAVEHNISRTAHAGEAKGPEGVWEVLRQLHPTRIGHGVRSIEDAVLLSELRAYQIHLEVCPTSNLQTNMYETYADHPVHQLYTEGISLSLNTDNHTITPITLDIEYKRIQATFGWHKEDYLCCNRYALQAAFLPQAQKDALEQRLLECFADCN
jgi:adenosine deaminase